MKKMVIPFSPPDISESEINNIVDTLRSGWITTGPKVKQLEEKISEWLGTPRCVCLGSQTACAETTLRILGIGPGDEVITSAYTYTATASVICHVGAKPVLVDIQKDTLEMDLDALERAITEKTKAIIAVDLAGVPCNYEKIYDISEKNKHLFSPDNDIQAAIGRVVVISDSAHALGAERNGVMVGNVADFSGFSFHAVKNFTTAEGGAMTWKHIDGIDDDVIYNQAQLLSLHGQSKSALDKSEPGLWEYDVIGTWYKCNMTDIQAAMGLAQFDRYPDLLKKRKEIIEKYDSKLKPIGIKTLCHYSDDYTSSGHLYITRIPGIDDLARREIIVKMAELGISTNVHYKPLPLLTAYKKLGFDIKDYPNAYNYYENEVTLPLYTKLTNEQVDYIIESYISVVKEYMR